MLFKTEKNKQVGFMHKESLSDVRMTGATAEKVASLSSFWRARAFGLDGMGWWLVIRSDGSYAGGVSAQNIAKFMRRSPTEALSNILFLQAV